MLLESFLWYVLFAVSSYTLVSLVGIALRFRHEVSFATGVAIPLGFALLLRPYFLDWEIVATISIAVASRFCYAVPKKVFDEADLSGKVAVVTGINPGSIGYHIAKGLLEKGARVIIVDLFPQAKLVEIANDLKKASKSDKVLMLQMNLLSIDSIRQTVDAIKKTHKKIDILYNNAGVQFKDMSQDGYPGTWAVHVLGPALFTLGIEELLVKSDMPHGARVVFTSSVASELWTKDPNFKSLAQGQTEISSDFFLFKSYCRAKLCENLLVKGLQRYLDAKKAPILISSFHPGLVATAIWSSSWRSFFTWPAVKLTFRSASDGAKIGLYLGTCINKMNGHDRLHAGQYIVDFEDRSKTAPRDYIGDKAEYFDEHWRVIASIAKEHGFL